MATSLARTKQKALGKDDICKVDQFLIEMIKEQKISWEDYTVIINRVESLRKRLESLVTLKQNFTDPEVLAASQALDEALNEFYRIYLLNNSK